MSRPEQGHQEYDPACAPVGTEDVGFGELRRRLINGFSKKVENLAHTVSVHFMYYDFARIYQTLRVTPAMETGISDRVWSLEEIVKLTD